MSRASASLAPATRASHSGRFSPVEIFDGQLDLSGERVALYESVCPTLRSAASPADTPRELQQLLERLSLHKRSYRAAGDSKEAYRNISMRQDRDDSAHLHSERTGQVFHRLPLTNPFRVSSLFVSLHHRSEFAVIRDARFKGRQRLISPLNVK